MFLHCRLHDEMLVGSEVVCCYKYIGQRFICALKVPPQPCGIVINAQRHATVVSQLYLAFIAHTENGFDATGNISGEKGNCPRGRN